MLRFTILIAALFCPLSAEAVIYYDTADQTVEGVLINKNTGARFTSDTGVTVRVSQDGTYANGAGTLTITEADQFRYPLAQNETDCAALKVVIDHADAVQPIIFQDSPLIGAAGMLASNVAQFGGTNGTFVSGIPAVNATQLSGSVTAADNSEIVFSTDFASNYNTTADHWKVDVTHLLGTAWLNPSTAGTPDVNVRYVSGDSVAADNAERMFDGSGFGPVMHVDEVDSVPTQTQLSLATGLGADSTCVGCLVVIHDASSPGVHMVAVVTNYSTLAGNIEIDPVTTPFTIAMGDKLEILAPSFSPDDRINLAAIKTKSDFLPSATAGATGGVFIAGTNAQTTVTSGFGANSITATSLATDAIGSSEVADGAIDAGAIATGAITSAKYDGSTAFPVTSADSGSTRIARTGADSDTLKTLSDQVDAVKTKTDNLPGSAANTTGGLAVLDSNGNVQADVEAIDDDVTAASGTVTFPGTLASTTNITGGTITTATNLTNLPTMPTDWLTAVGVKADAVTKIQNGLFATSTWTSYVDGAPTFAQAMDDHEYTSVRAQKLDNLDDLDMPVSDVRAQTPSLLVSTTIDGTPSSNTILVLTDGPPDDDALNGALVIVTDATDDSQKAVGLVKNYDQATKTISLVADPGIFEFDDDDKVDVIAGGAAIPLWLSGP